ncbi:MAG: hypothetical protein NXI30_28330 [bacterium]|nr:hypothetical protein [bacterium]
MDAKRQEAAEPRSELRKLSVRFRGLLYGGRRHELFDIRAPENLNAIGRRFAAPQRDPGPVSDRSVGAIHDQIEKVVETPHKPEIDLARWIDCSANGNHAEIRELGRNFVLA